MTVTHCLKDTLVRVTVRAEDLLPNAASVVLTFDHPCTVGSVVQALAPVRSTGLMILVNGKLAGWQTVLQDGDDVELIPALGGG